MAARIGSLYVDLTMNTRDFVSGMNRAQTATSRAAAAINRDLGLSQKTVNAFSSGAGNRSFKPYAIIAASRAYETAADRVNLLRGSLLAVTAVAGGFTAALSTNLIARYADTAINLSNQLRTVTDTTTDMIATQSALEAVSERSRSSLQSTITLYARTARAAEQLGLSQDKLLRVTETIQKAFSVGGATAAEAQGAAIQLSQGIASDRFSGEEFRSVAENAPVLLRGMAESLGVTIGKLREMAHAGELTADVVTKAILKASARIDKEFGETIVSMDRAITHVDNKLLEFIGNTDKTYGVTSLITKGIVEFGNSLEDIIPPLTQIAGLMGAVFLARNKGALGGGLGALIGGGAGLAFGGLDGAIYGAAAGGLAGFAGTKKDQNGLGFIGRIKADAAASREEVIRLTAATKDLANERFAADVAVGRAISGTQGDLIAQAPKSAQSAVARDLLAIQKLDENKITLLDKQRESYQRLAQVTSQITPKAAKLADTQLKAEAKVNDLLVKQLSIRNQISGVGADRIAAAAVEGRPTALNADEIKQRVRLEKELAATVASTARAQISVNERAAKVAALSSEADRKAAAERLAIGRQIMAQTDEMNKLDAARIEQTKVLAATRATAERAGAEIAQGGLKDAQANLDGVQRALTNTQARLNLARKAASGFQVGMRAAGRAVSDLVGLFGGPWGVAITGASLLFAQFAIDAQERAQKIANAKSIIDEVLAESGTAPGGDAAGSQLARQIEAVDSQIKTIRDGAGQAYTQLLRLLQIRRTEESPIGAIAEDIERLVNLPIKKQIDELRGIVDEFASGAIGVGEFRSRVQALQDTTDNANFTKIAQQVLGLANTVATATPAVEALKQQIAELQAVANDPINIVITTTFDALDAQPINGPLSSALPQFAAGIGFNRELEDELKTLRLVGDERKKAQYTAELLKKAEKDGVEVTDSIRKRISAYVDEKIALEARDAAVKESEKDNPYEKAIASIREKTAAQLVENETYGMTTYAIERARVVQELETAAKEARVALSPDVEAAIYKEADAAAAAAQASEDLQKKREAELEQIKFYKDTFSSVFIDLKNSLLEGASLWDAFANAAYNALNKIADRALGLAADGIFDLIFGSITGGLTGGFSPFGGSSVNPSTGLPALFANGGLVYGRGTGTSDSIPAMLSRGEYVLPAAAVKRIGVGNLEKMRGYANGGLVSGSPLAPFPANDHAANDNVSITWAPVINAKDGATRREIDAALRESERRFEERLPQMLAEARRRGKM